jgi:hypothetical protein
MAYGGRRRTTVKMRDIRTTHGAVSNAIWPPSGVGGSSGGTFIENGEGVVKDVERVDDRLKVTVEHAGQRAIGGVQPEKDWLDAVEKLLRAHIGDAIKRIGELEV